MSVPIESESGQASGLSGVKGGRWQGGAKFKTGVLKICCIAVMLCAGAGACEAAYDGPLPSNCGLNCAIFTLLKFDKQVNASELVEDLQVESSLAAPASFKTLKATFEKRGLAVVAVKGATAKDILGWRSSEQVMILQLHGVERAPHFICLYFEDPASNSVTIFDFPLAPVTVTVEAAWKYILQTSTGNVMLVGSKAVNLASTPFDVITTEKVMNQAAKENPSQKRDEMRSDRPKQVVPVVLRGESIEMPSEFLIGKVQRNKPEHQATFPIKNGGEKPLQILQIRGSCSCFLGFDGPRELAPGVEGKYVIRFDVNRLPIVDGRYVASHIAIESSDPGKPLVSIPVVMERLPWEKSAMCAPLIQNCGEQRSTELLGTEWPVQVWIPHDNNTQDDFRVDLEFDDDALEVSKRGSSNEMLMNTKWNVFSYVVRWKVAPKGFFDREIKFHIKSEDNPYVTTSIRGTCVE